LLLDGNLPEPVLAWLFARAGGAPVFVDPVSAFKCRRFLPWLVQIHTLKVNRIEAQALWGQPLDGEAAIAACAAWLHHVVESTAARSVLRPYGGLFFRVNRSSVRLTQWSKGTPAVRRGRKATALVRTAHRGKRAGLPVLVKSHRPAETQDGAVGLVGRESVQSSEQDLTRACADAPRAGRSRHYNKHKGTL
jgi:hypothetical protein